MCRQAKDTALVSMKLAIVLLLCQAMLLFGPVGYDTYYNLQVIRAMPEIIFSVLLAGGLGTAWLQTLYKRAGDS
ncbi:MAG: hypothetical protein LBI19_06225 [Oscillospiraceae bacterium]|jgi:hypothetical protein|nr:hypothetical protein [Oscillospiraceae bacterium]